MPKFPPRTLDEYRRKRSVDKTPEPFGAGASRPGLFVVQKHSATRLHYDLRLEWGGVLRSWAVPKGPSPDPADKRFAAETEDHPIEYADFEGVIPQGNYGAGPMIVWDRGRWTPLSDPEQGYLDGKLLFELSGYKLRGLFTLVRMKKPKEWLLIKETGDAHVRRGGTYPERSILSGLEVDELGRAGGRAAEVRAELERLQAPPRRLPAGEVEVMLAEQRDGPFDDEAWLFELKIDGFRAVAAREESQAALYYRRGANATAAYPELAAALLALPATHLVLDGEIAVLDEAGRPAFQRLQKRALLTQRRDIERAAIELPATYYAFDLLGFEEFDLRALPLLTRKALLRKVLPGPASPGPLRLLDHLPGQGIALYSSAKELGLEGIVGKRADSKYRAGRSRDWVKIRHERTGDFVVVGFTEPEGSRSGFGALHLALQGESGLVYVGRAGGGFGEKQLRETRAQLEAMRVAKPPCSGPVPKERGQVWVTPKLIVEVRYHQITDEGLLRQPVFLRFRPDKLEPDRLPPPEPELEPEPAPRPLRKAPRGASARSRAAAGWGPGELARRGGAASPFPKITNPEKIFWPGQGITKGDLIEYYRAVSPWLLPYLRDRPLTLTRYPDGIEGKSFFQKDAPAHTPGWVRTARVFSEGERDLDYIICDDLETLLYVINLGTIPLHLSASRISAPGSPDWCIIDLDPKGAPFAHVIQLARSVHALCEEIGLPSFAKTSGQKGLHVLIPLGGKLTHEQSKQLGELIARVVEAENVEIATTARAIAARGGKVYLDFLQNGQGKTIAGPFSARPVPGATVSTPLHWSEVNARLDPRKFDLQSVVARLKRAKKDPLRPVLELSPDLPAALLRLSQRVGR